MSTEMPKYRGIMAVLKEAMERGELRPGDRLPTVRALADQWSVSHATATRALRELCREGYAHVVGNATLVRDRGQAAVTVTRVQWGGRKRSGGGGNGNEHKAFTGPAQLSGWNEITSAGIVTAPGYVADVMEIEHGTQVLRVEWVKRWRRWMDGERRIDSDVPPPPFALEVHWYPASWAEISPDMLIAGKDDARSPLIDNGYGANLAEQAGGRNPIAGLEAQHARLADEREARLLEIEVGSVVLACVETWADAQGVTEYRESVYPAGVVRMVEHRDPAERDPE